MNVLVIASKLDQAGVNITTQLSQFRDKSGKLISDNQKIKNFDFYLCEKDILHNENLDLEKINKYDLVIFASKHVSQKKEKSLCLHTPGNFGIAKYGGEPLKVSQASALFLKQLFETLNKNAKESELDKKYNVTMEATHHGPLIDIPCFFIEIGSTETEWKDSRAGFIVAKSIRDTLESFEDNPYNEIAIAIGGPHYCPNFNKLQLKSNVAISHVIPQYCLPLKKEMIEEAISKTKEEVDFAILDWKGLGNSESRKQVLDILDELYVSYKKTSDLK